MLEKLLSKTYGNGKYAHWANNRQSWKNLGYRLRHYSIISYEYSFSRKVWYDPSVDTSFQTQNLTLIKFDVENESTLPFDNSSFDAVTMLCRFEHIEQHRLPQALREIYRVLKPGVFILTTPCPWADKLLRCLAF